MIPKIIHLIWVGGNPYPSMVEKCISSWEQYLPDYQFMKWDENNFDVHCNKYVEQAYECKKWAFVSDYIRLRVLQEYGGIYLDTDMLISKSLDTFLDNDAFAAFEVKDRVAMGIVGAVPNHHVISDLLGSYSNRSFIKEDGSLDTSTNVYNTTVYLLDHGLVPNGKEQTVEGVKVYPSKIFYPNNLSKKPTNQSYSVHLDAASWQTGGNSESFSVRLKHYLVRILRNIIGTDAVLRIRDGK